MHTIYNPLTHSIPTTVALVNPFGPLKQDAEILISSCCTGLRQLQRCSRKFAKIWTSDSSFSASESVRLPPPRSGEPKTLILLD